MKKLFLTAVAVVAFGFSGNANGAISCDVNINCFSFALIVYQGTLERTGSSSYATELSTWAYNDCLTWDTDAPE